MGQIDLFKNHSYFTGPCAKTTFKKQVHKKYKYESMFDENII